MHKKSSLGDLEGRGCCNVEKRKHKFDEKVTSRTLPRDPLGSLSGYLILFRDLKMIVWSRIRFGIGFRIKFEASLEAVGTRNAPRIDTKTS